LQEELKLANERVAGLHKTLSEIEEGIYLKKDTLSLQK
jgi:hypothetical protein